MLTCRSLLLAVVMVALPMIVQAAQPFDAKAFEEAQSQGKSILVDVKAPWCPTCAKQKPIVEAIEAEQPRLLVFDVDFDTAKDVLKRFNVQFQSTLIMFKGKSEVDRSTGQTDPAALQALIGKGL